MPINPSPEPTLRDSVTQRVSRVTGWHVASFLLGIIAGYIIGYVA